MTTYSKVKEARQLYQEYEELSEGTKRCPKCKIEKLKSEFSKNKTSKDGLNSWCKECYKEYRKKNRKRLSRLRREWRRKNPEKHREQKRKLYWRNPERSREQHRKWAKKYRNVDREIAWRKNNPEKVKRTRKKAREKNRATIRGTLSHRMEVSIQRALKGNKGGRKWETLVGYTLQDLIDRLSVNFQKGMSFENHGEWHIDHKKAKSKFNYTSPDDQEFKVCWSLGNLQPLWAKDNQIKYNKYK